MKIQKTPPAAWAGLICLGAALIGMSPSPVSGAPASPTPLTVEVTGLDRVRPAFAEATLARCRRDGMAETADGVRGCLYDTRLFSEVEVEPTEAGLRAAVDERWTLIPLPVVRSDDDDIEAGVFIIETNAFGANELLVLGGTYGTRGHQVRAIARDPSVAFSDWALTLQLIRRSTIFRLERGAAMLDAYDELSHQAQLIVGHRFGRTLEINGQAVLTDRRYDPSDGVAPPAALFDLAAGLGLRWRRARFKLYFDEGFNLRARARTQVYRVDRSPTPPSRATDLRLRFDWQRTGFADHALQLRPSLEAQLGGDNRTMPRLGGQPGLRGLPIESAWSRRYAALGIDYLIPLWRPSLGTITLAPCADLAVMDLAPRGGTERVWHAAAGGGLYLFLREIAFPGVGVVGGWSSTSGGYVLATIGGGR